MSNIKSRNLSTTRLLPALLIGVCLGMTSPGWAEDGRDDHGWTVLTLSNDGAWGTATDVSSGRAIASAIRNCKAMSRPNNNCGSKFVATRNGWSVAVLCGDEPIIAAARQYADAERIAIERETELRQVYRRDLARCVRVATVSPDGAIAAPYAQAAERR